MHLRVRFAETDQMGVAHHSAYVVWLEAARIEWLRDYGHSYKDLEMQGISLAVSSLQIAYKQSAFFDDDLQIDAVLTDLRSRRVAFDYRLSCGSKVLATASTTHTPVNNRGKLTRLPEAWLQALEKYLAKV